MSKNIEAQKNLRHSYKSKSVMPLNLGYPEFSLKLNLLVKLAANLCLLYLETPLSFY